MTGLLMGNSSRRPSSSSVTLTSLGHHHHNHHHHHHHHLHQQQQGFQANRCRADSGSTYSSSDTSNRSKTSSRRRSHRPRGCRGGSSRKKRRGGATNKVPKEIGGTVTVDEDDLSINVNAKGNVSTLATTTEASSSNVVSNTDSISNKPAMEINRDTTSLSSSLSSSKIKRKTLLQPGETRQKLSVSFADENRHQMMMTGSDENAGRTSTSQPFSNNAGNLKYMPLTSNAAVYGENNNKNDALPPPNMMMMMTKPKNVNSGNTSATVASSSSDSCLPPLRESMKSFLAASKEHQQKQRLPPPFISSSNQTLPATDQLLKASATSNGSAGFSQSQILPPLYNPEPAVHPSQEPGLRGPNIYALHGNHNHHHHHTTTTRTHASQRDNSTSTTTNTSCGHSNGILTSNINNSSSNADNLYNAHTDYHGRSHQLYGSYDNHNSNYSKYGANTLLPMQQRGSSSSHCGVEYSHYVSTDDEDNGSSSSGSSSNGSIDYESDLLQFQHCGITDRRAEKATIQESLAPVIINKHNSGTFLSNNNHHHHNKTTTTTSHNKTPGSSYRIERIEKQRQMMPEGGSLFVTSPKSFLMGWKSDDMPRM